MANHLLRRTFAALGAASLPSLGFAQASGGDATTRLAPVVVTATRTEVLPFDVPASIDRIDGSGIRDARLQVNLSESLGGVPGLLARDRQNYAQDIQISVRGFGARSTFGIRGVRLYVDGIPATLPDGQGQLSNVDLGSADRIEVLRGPFSALYGNSSGGVIQVFTEEGAAPPSLTTSLTGGSDNTVRLGIKASGASGSLGYLLSASTFSTDGYRDHSETERRLGNAKLTWRPDDASKLTLVANSVALPQAQDPLGLTRAQFEADPRSVDPVALDIRHPQDGRPDPGRHRLRTAPRRRAVAARPLLRRAPQHRAVPGDPARPAGEPAASGRRDRARPRLRRHRSALDPEDARRRSPLHAGRRGRLRRVVRAPPGLPELHRDDAGRAGRAAARRGQRRLELRPVPAGLVAHRRALDARRRRSPQQRALQVGRQVHRRPEPGRQRQRALQRDAAGGRADVRRDARASTCTRRSAAASRRRR